MGKASARHAQTVISTIHAKSATGLSTLQREAVKLQKYA
jgi:hypothetical protein